jgi:cobalt-zinc-cadmium efflux system outer membrane protein
MKTISLFTFLCAGFLSSLAQEKPSQSWTPERCVSESLEQNAALQAHFHTWKSLEAKATLAGSLPDPTVRYTQFIEEVETRVGPQESKIGVSQALPWFGKRKLHRQVASSETAAAYARFEEAKAALKYEVVEAWFEMFYAGRALGITNESIELVKHLERVAQARIVGGGSGSAAIKAQVELGKLLDQRATLEEMLLPLKARLNAAMNRPWDGKMDLPESVTFSKPMDISEASIEQNRGLQAYQSKVRQAEQAAKLARRERYPDLVLGADYLFVGEGTMAAGDESGADAYSFTIGLKLPLWGGKNTARIDQAESSERAAVGSRDQQIRKLESTLQLAIFRYRSAVRKTTLYGKTLIPQSEQSLKVAEESYRAGEADFLELIDAERLLLEFRLTHERAQVDGEISRAKIDWILGTTALQNKGVSP